MLHLPALLLAGALLLLAGAPGVRAGQAPEERWVRLPVGGRERLALIHLPPASVGSRPLPLVLVLHGGGENAEMAQRNTAFSARADKLGFIVAYPNGTGAQRRRGLTWNAGDCCGYARQNGVDDVAFLRALIARLRRNLRIDPLRIYAAGFGNGGMMAHRLACEASEEVAAVAVVGGALLARCQPAQPVSVVIIHGAKDPWVPFGGGKVGNQTFPAVADAVAFWVTHNGAQVPRRTERGSVVLETFPDGRKGTEVMQITLKEGTHAWPAGEPPAFSATGAILDFFAAHPKQ